MIVTLRTKRVWIRPVLILVCLSLIAASAWSVFQSYRVGALVPEVAGGVAKTLDKVLSPGNSSAQPAAPAAASTKAEQNTNPSSNNGSRQEESSSEVVTYEPIEIVHESGEVLAMATFAPTVLSQTPTRPSSSTANVAYALNAGAPVASEAVLISSSEEGWQLFGLAWYWWALTAAVLCLGLWVFLQLKRISVLKKLLIK